MSAQANRKPLTPPLTQLKVGAASPLAGTRIGARLALTEHYLRQLAPRRKPATREAHGSTGSAGGDQR